MDEFLFLVLDSIFVSLAVQNIFNNQAIYQLLKNKTKRFQPQLEPWCVGQYCHSIKISDIYYWLEYRSYSLGILRLMQTPQAPLFLIIISKSASSVTLQQHHGDHVLCTLCHHYSPASCLSSITATGVRVLPSKLWLLISLEIP